VNQTIPANQWRLLTRDQQDEVRRWRESREVNTTAQQSVPAAPASATRAVNATSTNVVPTDEATTATASTARVNNTVRGWAMRNFLSSNQLASAPSVTSCRGTIAERREHKVASLDLDKHLASTVDRGASSGVWGADGRVLTEDKFHKIEVTGVGGLKFPDLSTVAAVAQLKCTVSAPVSPVLKEGERRLYMVPGLIGEIVMPNLLEKISAADGNDGGDEDSSETAVPEDDDVSDKKDYDTGEDYNTDDEDENALLPKTVSGKLDTLDAQNQQNGPSYKFGRQVPRNWKEAAGHTKWTDAEAVELANLDEYETFQDLGFGVLPSGDYQQVLSFVNQTLQSTVETDTFGSEFEER
jgi:hypothetical protein